MPVSCRVCGHIGGPKPVSRPCHGGVPDRACFQPILAQVLPGPPIWIWPVRTWLIRSRFAICRKEVPEKKKSNLVAITQHKSWLLKI